ncbi:MAG TPA: response regulator [Pyrinomonadaceae bacterium]|jgi:CheY-like chemotaxis protein
MPDSGLQSRKRTILVVDDFDDTRLLLRTWLERKGYEVIEAHNGKQAVDSAKNHHPDLIIMDVEMPELDGLSATRQIREMTEQLGKVPILAVSAYGVEQFRREALAAGCNDYVSTPFEPDELEKLITSLIQPIGLG